MNLLDQHAPEVITHKGFRYIKEEGLAVAGLFDAVNAANAFANHIDSRPGSNLMKKGSREFATRYWDLREAIRGLREVLAAHNGGGAA